MTPAAPVASNWAVDDVLLAPSVSSGTTLIDGDLAFTRVNGDDPDSFSFVLLTDIQAGTEILLTTEYWGTDVPLSGGGTDPGPTFSNYYFTIQFTATSTISAGEEVHINADAFTVTFSSGGTLGTITSLGPVNPTGGNLIHSGGDSILAFQGSKASPVFIAGISTETGVSGTSANSWQTNFSVNDTQLPDGKVNAQDGWLGLYPFGTSSINEYDNVRYKESALHTGTKEDIMAAIMDVSNWEFHGSDTFDPSTTAFSVSSGVSCTMTASISSQTNIASNGGSTGSATVTPTDGLAPYTYLWDDGSSQTIATATGLAAGTYEVTVTDDNGCTATANATITNGLTASGIATNVSCNGGSDGAVDLTVTGGTSPYTYAWNNSATTEDLTGLEAMTYSVTVTDANGCTTTESFDVEQPTILTITDITPTNVSCNGGNDGSINLTVIGGNFPYSFEWSNEETSQNLEDIAAGYYSVTVTDAKGCTANSGVFVNQPSAIFASPSVTDANCNSNDGSIDLTVFGGAPPYTFLWDDNTTTEDRADLSAGIYTVTITDDTGCAVDKTVNVSNSDAFSVNGTPTSVSCNGDSDGAIDLTVTNGTEP